MELRGRIDRAIGKDGAFRLSKDVGLLVASA
jgi:hypothetical protein